MQKLKGDDLLLVRLADAARFESLRHEKDDTLLAFGARGKAPYDGYREALTLPAGNIVRIDPATLTTRWDPWGGTFAHLMAPYLIRKDSTKYKDDSGALSALPPPLIREGERVQPEWLFGFLRDPPRVRPSTILRMPKFN